METREHYQDLLKRIDGIGPIEEVAKNPDRIRQVLSADTDRHLFCALIDRINDAVEAKRLSYEELPYLRQGLLMDDIVKLKDLIPLYGDDPKRLLYSSEILDKVNYVSLLKDPQILAANYTHPAIINALTGKVPNSELVWWSNCGTFTTLPPEVQERIVLSVMQAGDIELAQTLLASATHRLKPSTVKMEKEDSKTL